MLRGLAAWAALALLPVATGLAAETSPFDPFVGSYVGRAEEMDVGSHGKELRDIDLVLKPDGQGRLRIAWANVSLVDGRRDVPGVRRRADETLLSPAEGRSFYFAGTAYDPFNESRPPQPLQGDPVRWGTVKDDTLVVFSLVIEEDGRPEIQRYARKRTPEGLTLDWQRLVDGALVRRMSGRAIRAD